ncbi:thioredoxin [Hymenobacter sp. BT635]|uniref:Thioredoxin n=1 Tax=Hymenobacter nitidus TaxID=2880929 RepID=A0ABS8ABV7_9BACT|nr:thioredoxin [Hymenobacter nitidus]MCB2377908.1 thioredoxin [Hymenobacter nitidus]
MPFSSLFPPLSPDTAVLLVLLPADYGQVSQMVSLTDTWIQALQRRLGASIRVLKIEAAQHPAVVLSFGVASLPACVLLHHGIELGRQEGLPTEETYAISLLLKMQADARESEQP